MKVLLINKYHYINGGSETYYFALGDSLKKSGVDVIYFSIKNSANKPCEQEKYFMEQNSVTKQKKCNFIEVLKLTIAPFYSFEAKSKVAKLLDDEKPDVIHLNNFLSQMTISIVFEGVKRNIPIVYTAHDLKILCPGYFMMNHGTICDSCMKGHYFHCVRTKCINDSIKESILAVVEAMIYRIGGICRHMDLIISPSNHHKRVFEEAEITHAPIIYMQNFLPTQTIFKNGTNNGNYYLYFGRLSKEKGLRTLIEGYAISGTMKSLIIVGKGSEEATICSLIKRYGLEEKVVLLGFKYGQELKDIVSNAHGVILPSECCENAPYSIIEAQAVGRPAIVSRNGGLVEMIKDGENGYIFTPKDAMDLAEKITMMDATTWDGESIVRMARVKYSANSYTNKLIEYYLKLIYQKKGLY